MLNKYRLYQRANGVFYWQDQESSKQGSLKTKDREVAEKLLHSKNESHRQPTINLAIARTYLAAHDPKMARGPEPMSWPKCPRMASSPSDHPL